MRSTPLLSVLVALLLAVPAEAQVPFWVSASDGLPTGPLAALQASADGEAVLAGTLGGLYWLRDGEAVAVPGVEDTEIGAIERAPDGVLYAVSTTDSTLFRSLDGATWEALPVPGALSVWGSHLAPLQGGLVYAFIQGNPRCDADRGGLVWHRSTDGGETWACLPDDPVLGQARDVVSTHENALLAATPSGVYGSADGGYSWEMVRYESGGPFGINTDEFAGPSGPFVLLRSRGDVYYRSRDGGRTWSESTLDGFAEDLAHDGTPARLYAGLRSARVFRYGGPPGGEYYPGGVHRSDDGGLTWEATALGDTTAAALAFLDSGAGRTLLAAGYSGLFQSTDAEESWTAFEGMLDNQWVIDIAFSPGGTGYASTYPRRLHRIDADSPSRWASVALPPFDEALLDYGASGRIARPRLWELGVAPDGTLYAVDGNLLRSDDGGQTWEAMPVGFILEDLDVRPDGSLLAASVFSGVFRSTDRGASWERVGGDLSDERSLDAVAEAADGTVYAGGLFALYVLPPGAAEWEVVPLEGYGVRSLVVDDATGRVWAGTQQYVEVPPGASPRPVPPGPSSDALPAAYRTEHGVLETGAAAWAASRGAVPADPAGSAQRPVFQGVDAGGVFRSDDGGQTWGLVGLDSVVVEALAVGADGRLLAGPYASDDGGETWTYLGAGMQSTEVLALTVAPDGHAWAGTRGGGAYRSSRSTVDAEGAELPAERAVLEAAYPNPALGAATLALRLGQAQSAVVVEAFDVLGRRVAVLHDGPLAAGRHDLTFGGVGLPSGVYVVRATGGGFARIQRVTLVR